MTQHIPEPLPIRIAFWSVVSVTVGMVGVAWRILRQEEKERKDDNARSH